MKKLLFLLMALLSMSSVMVYAADDDEIIEFQGDRYVIHVDKMNPDSEMTLMDVLNTCPEYLSIHGKEIDLNYKLRIDNIDLITDPIPFLANVKACEVDHIQICSNTSVAKAVWGTKGVIDIYYREDVKTDGKVALTGNTYGNGMLYADVTNKSEKLTVKAYAMTRSSYGKAFPTDVHRMTDRVLTEYTHVSLDWKMSQNDRLFIKAYQRFSDCDTKLFDPYFTESYPYFNRYADIVFSYSHTFKNDAILFAEAGSDYTRENNNGYKMGDSYPYCFVEFNTPLFTPDLWLMIGSEMDYENTWNINQNREQYLVTDFYAQLDYTHGPWVLTLGDRYRMLNYWNRQYDSADRSMWTHERNNHCYLASVGYKAGRHFFQGLFARRFFVPEVSDFLVDDTAPTTALRYDAGSYRTNLAHQGVLRYSYQQKNFFLHSSVECDWYSHLPGPNHLEVGFRNSIYWKTGLLELTLGANYYHQHLRAGAGTEADNDNFVTLKAAPALNLSGGFRLSSTLLYSSRRSMENKHAHLFATVKANKQLGKKCNVFAEYHDLAGYMTGEWEELLEMFQNRAVSVGVTIYPFRK
ncbi:MAG: hypothetical protein J5888_01890 [Bacteroidaceae bacterium]|nr:hypothetical protein [Bacteroidaceae bacterium]